MIINTIDHAILRQTMDKLPEQFSTRDVSENATVLAAHPHLTSHRNYHAFIGKTLGLLPELERSGRGPRGVRWQKRTGGLGTSPSPATAARVTPLMSSSSDGLGPQYSGDNPLAKRLRRHQSWYRHAVLGLPCGTGPQAKNNTAYGNMLRREDGAVGRNFLTPEAFAVAQRRVAEGAGAVEPFRLYHNMLSSQPMCFNLFGALVDDLPLATRLAKALWGGRVSEVTAVRLEYAPLPASEYLDDKTAFDAFIEYRTRGGELGFIGVETKLSEPFSQRHCDGAAYRRWMTADSPWRPDDHDRVDAIVHNQLWRDHLLAWSMLRRAGSPWSEGRLMVLHHSIDTHCGQVVDGYRGLLQDVATFEARTLDDVVDVWKMAAPDAGWIDSFAVRYTDLELSA